MVPVFFLKNGLLFLLLAPAAAVPALRRAQPGAGTDVLKDATFFFRSNGQLQPTKLLNDNNAGTFVQVQLNDAQGIEIRLNGPHAINRIVLKEPLQTGSRVAGFTVSLLRNHQVLQKTSASSIGVQRILTMPVTVADVIDIRVNAAKDLPLISEVSAYNLNTNQ